MNTWWKVADMLDGKGTQAALENVEFGLEVVTSSEMPDEVRQEAEQLLHDIAQLKSRLSAHRKHMLVKSDGVMWPVI